VQKLAGVINWVRPYLGLPSSKLQPLLELLKGDLDISAAQVLTPEAKQVIDEVEHAIMQKHVWRIDLTVSVQVFVLIDNLIPFAMLARWNSDWQDPLHVL
ncbi:POK11 protein, partial [Brachypteracias leptosomus]|nr:POK11 protein [Brachypteracias leptosomus]